MLTTTSASAIRRMSSASLSAPRSLYILTSPSARSCCSAAVPVSAGGKSSGTTIRVAVTDTRSCTWFLVEADHVAAGIAEARGDLRRVAADRLDDLAAVRRDGVDRRGHAVHHDIEEQ